jgi:hypothetical protein
MSSCSYALKDWTELDMGDLDFDRHLAKHMAGIFTIMLALKNLGVPGAVYQQYNKDGRPIDPANVKRIRRDLSHGLHRLDHQNYLIIIIPAGSIDQEYLKRRGQLGRNGYPLVLKLTPGKHTIQIVNGNHRYTWILEDFVDLAQLFKEAQAQLNATHKSKTATDEEKKKAFDNFTDVYNSVWDCTAWPAVVYYDCE